MVWYKCDRCNKHFKLRGDYLRHVNRKIPCKIDAPICTEIAPTPYYKKEYMIENKEEFHAPDKIQIEKINELTNKKQSEVNDLKCNYCNKQFSRNYSLNRHINLRCEIKKQQDNQKEQIFQKLLDEMMELKKEISELKKSNKNINKGTINNSQNVDNSKNINNMIDQSQTFNIQLVAFGKEDYDKLTIDEYKFIINKGFKSVQHLAKSIHFNKNHPENHNIYISNLRDNYVMVYDGGKWELRNRKETIDELFFSKKDILNDKFDEKINF